MAWAVIIAVPPGMAYGRSPHPGFQAIARMRHVTRALALRAAVYLPSQRLACTSSRRSHASRRGAATVMSGSVRCRGRKRGGSPIWFSPIHGEPIWRSSTRGRAPTWSATHGRVADRPELSGARPTGNRLVPNSAPGLVCGRLVGRSRRRNGWIGNCHSRWPGSSTDCRLGAASTRSHASHDRRPPSGCGGRPRGGVRARARWRRPGQMDSDVRGAQFPAVPRHFLKVLEALIGTLTFDRGFARHGRRWSPGAGCCSPVRHSVAQPLKVRIRGGDGRAMEYDVATGRQWRWTSERSTIRMQGPQASRGAVTLRGESPLRYFDDAPTVRVTVGGRVVAQMRPVADFEWTVTVPAADIQRGEGVIVIETDRVYLPGSGRNVRRASPRIAFVRMPRRSRLGLD